MTYIMRPLFVLSILMIVAGCAGSQTIPDSTRTGKVHDIRIGKAANPNELTVNVGDEVRWINSRGGAIHIVFVDKMVDRVSCQNGFQSGWFKRTFSSEAGRMNATTIPANGHASLCFADSGSYTYNARMESTAPGGEMVASGKVIVQ